MAERKLTARQKKFIAEYVQCLNASEAARRAGYSENGVGQTAHNLLKKTEIKEEIDRLFKEKAMSSDEIVARLAAQARGDIIDLLDPSTLTVDWAKAKAAGATHLIKKLKQTIVTRDDQQTEIFEIELYDSQKALVHLGKTLAMFTDKKEITGKDGKDLTILLQTGMDITEL